MPYCRRNLPYCRCLEAKLSRANKQSNCLVRRGFCMCLQRTQSKGGLHQRSPAHTCSPLMNYYRPGNTIRYRSQRTHSSQTAQRTCRSGIIRRALMKMRPWTRKSFPQGSLGMLSLCQLPSTFLRHTFDTAHFQENFCIVLADMECKDHRFLLPWNPRSPGCKRTRLLSTRCPNVLGSPRKLSLQSLCTFQQST